MVRLVADDAGNEKRGGVLLDGRFMRRLSASSSGGGTTTTRGCALNSIKFALDHGRGDLGGCPASSTSARFCSRRSTKDADIAKRISLEARAIVGGD